MKFNYLWLSVLCACAPLLAQHEGHKSTEMSHGQDMPRMHDMSHMDGMHDQSEAAMYLMHQASGTSMNPRAWTMPMLTASTGDWHWMFMGQAYLTAVRQTGPRGRDKVFSSNWGMISAEHRLGVGNVSFETMLSLEPGTITQRRYPELFQTGETAYGRPLVDAQHPHDFVMSLGVHYARPLGEDTLVHAYFAPVGDPALGPVAFPHRASALEIPQAPLGHHWQDSTHIANDVITVGIRHKKLRLEASGFHGTEPDESRWNIDHGPLNSWSTRLSVFPSPRWVGQVSVGRIVRPERQEPGDVVRTTASLHYTRPLGSGPGWSTSVIWGRNHKTTDGRNTAAYLAETLVPAGHRNFVTGRVESVDKDELFPGHTGPPGVFRIGAYTAGFTRDLGALRTLTIGFGANLTAYSLPAQIREFYGAHPVGANLFLRVRLQPAE